MNGEVFIGELSYFQLLKKDSVPITLCIFPSFHLFDGIYACRVSVLYCPCTIAVRGFYNTWKLRDTTLLGNKVRWTVVQKQVLNFRWLHEIKFVQGRDEMDTL
jgi:hypothetical protein